MPKLHPLTDTELAKFPNTSILLLLLLLCCTGFPCYWQGSWKVPLREYQIHHFRFYKPKTVISHCYIWFSEWPKPWISKPQIARATCITNLLFDGYWISKVSETLPLCCGCCCSCWGCCSCCFCWGCCCGFISTISSKKTGKVNVCFERFWMQKNLESDFQFSSFPPWHLLHLLLLNNTPIHRSQSYKTKRQNYPLKDMMCPKFLQGSLLKLRAHFSF